MADGRMNLTVDIIDMELEERIRILTERVPVYDKETEIRLEARVKELRQLREWIAIRKRIGV